MTEAPFLRGNPMSIYACYWCGEYKSTRTDPAYTARTPGLREAQNTCEKCLEKLCEKVDAGEIEKLTINGGEYVPNR